MQNSKFKMKLKIQKKSPQLWWGEILVIFNHASGAKILLIEFRSLTCIEEKSLILHFEFCILNFAFYCVTLCATKTQDICRS